MQVTVCVRACVHIRDRWRLREILENNIIYNSYESIWFTYVRNHLINDKSLVN